MNARCDIRFRGEFTVLGVASKQGRASTCLPFLLASFLPSAPCLLAVRACVHLILASSVFPPGIPPAVKRICVTRDCVCSRIRSNYNHSGLCGGCALSWWVVGCA